MKLLTNEQHKLFQNAKLCYICRKQIEDKYVEDKKYQKVRDHCHYTGEYRGTTHGIHNLKYSIAKKIPIGFHIGSNYDHHFIKKTVSRIIRKTIYSFNRKRSYKNW